jgi:hypothetical protein
MPETVRLQVEMDQEQMAELEQLLQLGGLKTKKELFNNALTLLKWAAREKAKGNAICSINEQDHMRKELEMPFLENVRRRYATDLNAAEAATGGGAPEIEEEDDEVAIALSAGTLRMTGKI